MKEMMVRAIVACILVLSTTVHMQCHANDLTNNLEYLLSQRMSIRNWDPTPIESRIIEAICKNSFVSAYELEGMELYVLNSTGIYEYNRKTAMFVLKSLGDRRSEVGLDVDQLFVSNAPCIFLIVWNNEVESNSLIAYKKGGIIAQNLYILAIRYGLGGVVVGDGIYAEDKTTNIQNHLGLSSNLKPALLFPLGHLSSGQSYPDGDLQQTIGNLPSPLESDIDVLDLYQKSVIWKNVSLSQHQLSNILWSTYGYSLLGSGHRTVPSAYGQYYFQIYVFDETGVYNYTAESHSLYQTSFTDKRIDVATHVEAPEYMGRAPVLLVFCWNNQSEIFDSSEGKFINTGFGCCIQDLYLSATLWNVSITPPLATSNYEALRTDLSDEPIPDTIYPMFAIGLGEKTIQGDINGDFKVNIVDVGIIARAFQAEPGDSRWNINVDINNDQIVNIVDIVMAVINFGKKA